MEGKIIRPKMIFILVVIALCVIIFLQNMQVVTLRLFFWNISMSQIIFMPLLLVVGFIIGFLVSRWLDRRHSL